MSLTLRQAIDGVLARVGLASGADVQVYSEDIIKAIIHHKINVLFDEHWWPQFYNPGETFTLDGTTGVVTADLTTKIKRYQDIRFVWYKDDKTPLPRIGTRDNPNNVKRMSIVAYGVGGKIFRIYPLNTTGNLTIAYRTLPTLPENEDDVIDFDRDLIILGSAYDYLNGLGTNPSEEEKLLTFFNNRYDQLKKIIESGDVYLGDNTTSFTSGDWQETN